MPTVYFTHHVSTNSGAEVTFDCVAELSRERGQYYLDGFEARNEDATLDFDRVGFIAYCRANGEKRPDLLALACDALEAEHEDRRAADDV
jgi:hypothetical protein